MLKHIFILIVATFIAGFATGVYVYFVTLIPGESKPNNPTTDEFEIVADMYGGCAMLGTCPSYRILGSGSYTYLTSNNKGERGRFEDTISTLRVEELENLLKATDFEKIEDSEFQGTCPVAFDATAYEFRIVINDEIYNVDTCIEDVDEEPLIKSLIDYFEIFKLVHSNN